MCARLIFTLASNIEQPILKNYLLYEFADYFKLETFEKERGKMVLLHIKGIYCKKIHAAM